MHGASYIVSPIGLYSFQMFQRLITGYSAKSVHIVNHRPKNCYFYSYDKFELTVVDQF